MSGREDPPMTQNLYYSPGACSLAAHIALEEIGKPFRLTLASTSDGATKSAEFLRINPKGRVPVLATDTAVFTEVPAILLHLALSNPNAKLLPGGPDGTVRCVEWFNWLSGTVHAVAVRQIWRPESFIADGAQFPKVVEKGRTNLRAAFAAIENKMTGRLWAIADTYSIVDLYLLVFFRWGNRMGMDMRHDYPAWTQNTLEQLKRPAVTRALNTEAVSIWS